MTYYWQVVPICEAQLKDVREEDLIEDGVYRKCDIYRGGGGYDRFGAHFFNHYEYEPDPVQFVVQLYGCNLACPYCYVTRAGIWGDYICVDTQRLVRDFLDTGLEVFHLMGGAPGLQLEHWKELVDILPEGVIFHSDLVLTENDYSLRTLNELAGSRAKVLLAVNVKGTNTKEWERLTGRKPRWDRFWNNLNTLIVSEVPMYITFTGLVPIAIERFWIMWYARTFSSREHDAIRKLKESADSINIIDYEALK